MADEKYLNHYKNPPQMPHFAPFCKGFSVYFIIHTISDSVANYAK